MRRFKVLFAISLFGLCKTVSCWSSMFSVQSAPNLAPNLPSPTVKPGAEKVFSFGRFFQIGGSYMPTFLSYSSGAYGALRLFNIVSHFRIPGLAGLRFDTALGASQRTLMQIYNSVHLSKASGLAPGGALGLSYPLTFGKNIALGPHIGMRYLRNGPASFRDLGPQGAMFEAGTDLVIKL